MPRQLTWIRIATAVMLGLLVTAPAFPDDPDRTKQIADIEAKMKALASELDKLKSAKATPAQPEEGLPANWVKSMTWRSIGPATMGGRITAISVYEADPTTYWVATASGGLLKTENNGTTFTHQFDRETTVSIGDVCVAPSDKNIVWVGTGEANPRNSVSYGNGVYKSTDGGKTWKHMGLRDSFQIGKVLVHPKNPNTVYVGALGRLYGPNPERGVYKTVDGGQSWARVLHLDDETGCIDLRMHPTDPDTLLAGMWRRQRDAFDSYVGERTPDGVDAYDPVIKYGPKGGIYRTSNGGDSWAKIEKGLPTVATGRIGLDWYLKDPNIVFAIIDTEKVGTGTPPAPTPFLGFTGEDGEGGVKLTAITANAGAAKAGLKADDIVVEADGKKTPGYQDLVDVIRSKKVGDKIEIKFKRGSDEKTTTATLDKRPEPESAGGGGRGREGPTLGLGFRGELVEGGVRVQSIEPDAANAKAGLSVGDVIVAVGDRKVTDTRSLSQAINADRKAGDKVKVTVMRGDDKKELTLVVEALTMALQGRGGGTTSRPYGAQLAGQRENAQNSQGPDGFQTGGVYKSTDAGLTWTRVNSINPRPMYFSVVRVDPTDDKKLYVLGVTISASTDGGKTFKAYGNRAVHADQHALWINPKDGRHMIIGTDGGFYLTHDRMEHWEHLALLPLGQFYHVGLDTRMPYNVYGGLQDNGSWGGPSRTLRGTGPVNEDWIVVNGGDGFVSRADPTDPDWVFAESQDGNVMRRNLKTGEGGQIRYRPKANEPTARYNWNTPYILSHFNPKIIYVGGDRVFRSVNQGATLRPISTELTKSKRGTLTALAESPKNAEVLWAGSDDGALWVTRDGGANWQNVYDKLGAPPGRWVATIETGRTVEGRAYVCLDAHRSNDDKPYLFATDDFGKTWKNITSNLPAFGSTRCLREDPVNPNLLLCGTEFAVFASIDRGQRWTKINNNLPTVAVHELAIHPTVGEVVAATHGRSLWILDIMPLRQMKADTLTAPATLYAPATAVRWRLEPARGAPYGGGSKKYYGENPPAGAAIFYSLTKPAEKASLKIVDFSGQPIRELPVKKEPGLHKVQWDLTRPSLRTAFGLQAGTELPEEAMRRPGGLLSQAVPAGTYRIVLTVDGQEFSQPVKIETDPNSTSPGIALEDEDE